MSTAFILFLALLIDAAMGEPKWLWSRLPHPAVLMGRCVQWWDKRFNGGDHQRAKGILAMTVMVIGAGTLGYAISLLGGVVTVLVVAVLLAHKSLLQHVGNVADGLRMSLPEGRRQVAMIVGRDTRQMDQNAVARGAIESAAENFSDGVIAPAFWFLVGGLPGLLIYKITNTADSMIGYRTPKHEKFGWAAARLDDILNWVPARVTAVLIALPAGQISATKSIAKDAKLHRSPNAGWPESAMARALAIALAGPRSYEGKMQDFAWVNAQGARQLNPTTIDAACAMLCKAWIACVLIALFLTLF